MTETASATTLETERGAIPDKWGKPAKLPTVEHFHSAVRRLVAQRFEASGKSWEEAVIDPDLELTRADFEQIEADLLATGYRFVYSAQVSFTENPDNYKPAAGVGDSGNQPTDEQGRTVVGAGDNVAQAKSDLIGTARFIGTVEVVMQMLTEGVPEGTIALIDDSGGTLTAPILEEFAGIVCMAGTVRSHLGILAREASVPCLMAAEIDGLADGDQVLVEYSKPAVDAYAARDDSTQSRITKVS